MLPISIEIRRLFTQTALSACIGFSSLSLPLAAEEEIEGPVHTEAEIESPVVAVTVQLTAMQEAMWRDLDHIKNMVEAYYAPIERKKTYHGWDLDLEIDKAKQKVLEASPLSAKAYQKILLQFFKSMKDYHVMVRFFSTEKASLPFQVASAEGRYFIQYIDRSKLSPFHYPLNNGDELISFDGRPVDEVVQEFKRTQMGSESGGADQARACMYLTEREGLRGFEVPKGPVTIAVKSPFSSKEREYQLVWEYQSEKVSDVYDSGAPGKNQPLIKSSRRLRKLEKSLAELTQKWGLFMDPHTLDSFISKERENPAKADNNPHAVAAYKSFVPNLGKVLVDGEEVALKALKSGLQRQFHWYIYETEDHQRIGYVRIPVYVPLYSLNASSLHLSTLLKNVSQALREFEEIIQRMEGLTDALVIDQVNNPGGLLFYTQALASMLTTESLNNPKEHWKLNQKEVYQAVDQLKDLEKVKDDFDAFELFEGNDYFGLPANFQTVQMWIEQCRFLIEQWEQGKTLTDPIHVGLVDKIHPHPRTRYSKPILFLTNELDFSCADFLPAILADSGRAKLFGTGTAGAGGCVWWHRYPNAFGLMGFSLTASLAVRADGSFIEDVGVKPHESYEMTVLDRQMGYSGYAQAINRAVDKLVKESSMPKPD